MHSGYVAIVGRPNVGKSTLLNRLIGQKISITSRKPQTTRHSILGIRTLHDAQILYVDTPGLNFGEKRAMNRYMNRTVAATIEDVDVILFLVEADQWKPADEDVLKQFDSISAPVILVINKVDKLADKQALLPFTEQMAGRYAFNEIIPVSALQGLQVDGLETQVAGLLPEGMPLFPEDQVTDRSERFLVAEIIREKLMLRLGDELPYSVSVEMELFEERKKMTRLAAIIWVESDSQKRIVIGKQGTVLKSVGTEARRDIEELLECKVYLQLWVKVKKGWADDERALKRMGYTDH